MSQLLYIAVIIISVIVIDSNAAGRKPSARIVGGVTTTIANVPYIVTIQSWYFEDHNCGGTIISDRWILTAAHCTEEGNKKYYVRVGSAEHANGGSIYNVTEIINHKLFVRATMDYDISLLKLDGSITPRSGGVKALLPAQDEPVPTDQTVRVSGWGWTQNDKESRDILRTVVINVVDHDKCIDQYKKMYVVTNNMICAAGPNKDACQKDSGGPLTINENKVIGIVSWGGDKCADAAYPGVYTRVSAFRDWIREKTGI